MDVLQAMYKFMDRKQMYSSTEKNHGGIIG